MGILDQVAGALGGQGGAGGGQILPLLIQLIQQHPGGLQGLVEKFTQAGLGQQVQSWVGTGENLPVAGADIMKVFSGGQLGDIASRLGMSEPDAAGALATHLPSIVNQLTPGGAVDGDLLAKGLSMLGGLKL